MENKPVPNPPEGQLLIYQDGALRVQVRIYGTTVWLTQRLMAELYQVSVKTINEHLIHIYEEGERDPAATIRKFRIVQAEGSRQVSRMVEHYNLDAIEVPPLPEQKGSWTKKTPAVSRGGMLLSFRALSSPPQKEEDKADCDFQQHCQD